MSMRKEIMIFWICAMVASSLLSESARGQGGVPIKYPPIGRGDPPECKGGSCLPPPSNPPSRGCEKATRCRSSPPSKITTSP
ncbi:hypothetical protein F3Y22_tig00110956pilonHSYRG00064 [Hibiscus syriacus]|uniref:Rapid ALkalinization Factor n=1 Tax=Hibiscus syriacus TaxID=106335 RepID=A0A6A2ZAZ1_HIBSY|nr:hypothetical protein F3Y22_tig00110956pilonHSYRG00064 [Hibiscus syriacus]